MLIFFLHLLNAETYSSNRKVSVCFEGFPGHMNSDTSPVTFQNESLSARRKKNRSTSQECILKYLHNHVSSLASVNPFFLRFALRSFDFLFIITPFTPNWFRRIQIYWTIWVKNVLITRAHKWSQTPFSEKEWLNSINYIINSFRLHFATDPRKHTITPKGNITIIIASNCKLHIQNEHDATHIRMESRHITMIDQVSVVLSPRRYFTI